MKIDPNGYRVSKTVIPPAGQDPVHTQEAETVQDTPFDPLSRNQEAVVFMWEMLQNEENCCYQGWPQDIGKGKYSVSCKDKSSQLVRRLVSASGQFEVRSVISEASSNMIGLRMVAALCKGKEAESAKAAIARLEKLISRASRKIKDLDREDALRDRRRKAEKQKQERRAQEIKEELRKKQQARMAREQGYLWERGHKYGCEPLFRVNAATEAHITQLAEAMAAAEAAMASGESGAAAAVGGVDGGGGAAMSGEAAAPEGGEGEASV